MSVQQAGLIVSSVPRTPSQVSRAGGWVQDPRESSNRLPAFATLPFTAHSPPLSLPFFVHCFPVPVFALALPSISRELAAAVRRGSTQPPEKLLSRRRQQVVEMRRRWGNALEAWRRKRRGEGATGSGGTGCCSVAMISATSIESGKEEKAGARHWRPG